MPNVYKVLGQNIPSATTATTLYTVPASTSTVVSTVMVTNQGAASAAFRIAIRPAGETLANKHYIAFDVTIAALDSVAVTVGLTLATTDIITVYSSTSTVSFNAYGSEIS